MRGPYGRCCDFCTCLCIKHSVVESLRALAWRILRPPGRCVDISSIPSIVPCRYRLSPYLAFPSADLRFMLLTQATVCPNILASSDVPPLRDKQRVVRSGSVLHVLDLHTLGEL
jgi:hypothetical protein